MCSSDLQDVTGTDHILLALLEDPSIDVEIEYRSPAQPGEKVVLRNGTYRWIASPEGETHASLIVIDRVNN